VLSRALADAAGSLAFGIAKQEAVENAVITFSQIDTKHEQRSFSV
jgi:hypothetical protein